jgi:hypothetical protein
MQNRLVVGRITIFILSPSGPFGYPLGRLGDVPAPARFFVPAATPIASLIGAETA